MVFLQATYSVWCTWPAITLHLSLSVQEQCHCIGLLEPHFLNQGARTCTVWTLERRFIDLVSFSNKTDLAHKVKT